MMSTKERELLRQGKTFFRQHRLVSQGTDLLVNRFGLALRPSSDAAETLL
jgi:hypothetical protein